MSGQVAGHPGQIPFQGSQEPDNSKVSSTVHDIFVY